MNELINFGTEKKVTSVYLTEQINHFRSLEGNRAVLQHKSFLGKIENEFDEEIDRQNILPISYKDSYGREQKCYELNFEQSLQLLMSESKIVRKGVIEVLKSQQEIINNNSIKIPKTFAEALRFAADQEEKKEMALIELQNANKKIELNKHKVTFADSVMGSSNSVLIRQFAKDLCDGEFEIGQNRLFEWLRDNKYINGENEPYQQYIAQGLFEVITRTVGSSDSTIQVKTTKLTGKGQLYFTNKLKPTK